MLVQVTTPGNAAQLGIDFADYYEASALRQCAPAQALHLPCSLLSLVHVDCPGQNIT